ncbi:TPA_asm: DUF2800 domain-containing protein [Listeria monocytogenes]|nr:DUF2800 domain-containing protein [Listeria monocytogenes]HAB7656214.1 DUF2800 domain-containing protein [Listeria monocytogenes]HAB7874306.1 DUF2800 domain-containing protein [Listeria monocytogenes]HAB7883889.1 DUF2800 domain-containing protein [Listeria monocytogenes]HAC0409888.1 DUF2800 domain-containing protein [Listeria monocytogenes]
MSSPILHAKLSASSAKRWLTCPGSIRMSEGFENKTSVFAEEGTAAHELSELKLQKETGVINKVAFNSKYKKFKKTNEYYSLGMDDYTDEYVSLVLEKLHAYEDAFIALERRVDLSRWVPESFGTSDVIIIADGVLEVIDLKYGTGVAVSAEENPQAMLYGLGALNEYDMMYDFHTIRMTIVQIRLGDVSTFEISAEDLLRWGNEFVKPRAELAMSGEGECVPDEDACRFCPAKAVCRARAEKNLEIAAYEFSEPPDKLSKEEIATILLQSPEIKKWLEHVSEYALTQARDHDEHFPGLKLVEGRSNRIISNKELAAERLQAEGFEEIFKPRELLALTKLEKTIGKEAFGNTLSELIIKPPGKPALVAESDKRPELNTLASALDDFK